MTDKNFIFVISTKNDPTFVQCYSSDEKVNEALAELILLRRDWVFSIKKRKLDGMDFWSENTFQDEVILKRIKKCFDKQFILLIYFSFLTFLWIFFKKNL